MLKRLKSWCGELAPALLPALALLLSRLPVIAYPRELDPDEGQMLAQAMRYLTDPVPWRAVDGTTSGPFNSWFPLLLRAVGARLTYSGAHALAALAWVLTLLGIFFGAARFFGRNAATIATWFGALWLAANQEGSYVHYSSETLPVLLLSAALAGIAAESFFARGAAAVLLGIVPWAKIQGLPIAGVAGLWLVAVTLWPHEAAADEASRAARWRRAGILVALSLLPTAGMLMLVGRGGALDEMWQSYFAGNLRYAGPFGPAEILARARIYFFSWPIGPWLLLLALVWAVAAARGQGWLRGREVWRQPIALAVALTLVSFLAALRPEKGMLHHQLILLPGLMLLTAATTARLETRYAFTRIRAVAAVAAVCFLASQWRAVQNAVALRATMLQQPTSASVVLRMVRGVAPGFRSLFVWGWFPPVYIEGEITPPTRDIITQYLGNGLPGQDLFRANFMRDFIAASPDVVVDSGDRLLEHMFSASLIRDFPEFDRYVREHYTHVGTVLTSSGPVHIYVRNQFRRG